MEGTPLFDKLQILETPPVLPSLTNDLTITVFLYKSDEPDEITITGLAPFHTIDDLSRAIWLHQDTENRFFPKYCFLATEIQDEPGMFTPSTRSWYSGDIEDEAAWIKLPNPIPVIQRKLYQDAFVDATGEKKETIRSVPRGRATLESAYLQNGGEMPIFHCFAFDYLLRQYTGPKPMAARDWFGLFYPYFPTLQNKLEYTFTESDRQLATQLQTVIEAKLAQTKIIDDILSSAGVSAKIQTTAVKKLYFSWKRPIPAFDGVDTLFYSAPVNEIRPFMRLLTTNTIPLTKLYQPNPTKPPFVSDITLLRSWVSERAPDSSLNVLFIKALLRPAQLGVLPLFATIRVNDDATADFTVQPPKTVRMLEFTKDLGALGQVLTQSTEGMPFSVQDVVLDHADITVELDFGTVAPRDVRKRVLDRLAKLGTFFQPVIPPTEETRTPLICLRYKNVSNFVTQDRIFSYLTYSFQRTGFEPEQLPKVAQMLATEFEMSLDEAQQFVQDYLTKKEELTVIDPETKEISQVTNTGTDIAIFSQSVSSFAFQIYNLQSIEDLQRIVSLLGVVFTTSNENWDEATGETRLPSEEDVSIASALTDSASINEEIAESMFANDEVSAAVAVAVPTIAQAATAAVEATSGKKPKVVLKAAAIKAQEPAKGEQKIVSFGYLIDRLHRLDPVLYNFKSKPGIRVYSSQCGSVDDRQPVGFTQEEYLRIRKLYAEDEAKGKVGFIEYGVPDTEKQDKEAKGKREQITVLRYGSNPASPNYYICSHYLCLRDVLPVLKDDFLATVDREGKSKPTKTCPFCHGKIIENPSKPQPGETILKRANRPKGDYPHLYVGFLARGQHPQGYDLPCCFALKKNISWSDPRFKFMRDAAKKATAVSTVAEQNENDFIYEEEEQRVEVEQSLKYLAQQKINYEQLRYKIGKEYIVGPEKFPLEAGKVGLPNLALDAYFGQDSSKMVERPSVKMEFVGTAKGLFRMGVLNKASFTNDSLFAALAPFLGKNSVSEVADMLKLLITPRVFLNLNFGNLLLEFFKPELPEPPLDKLTTWARKYLQIYKPETKEELSRFYRSYHNFLDYLKDPSQIKQMRHFANALAEPGLLTPNGLNLVVLEYMGDPRESGTQIEISCPLQGIDMNMYTTNNIGFITHSPAGIWEPLLYVDRVVKKETITAEKEGYYSISYYELNQPNFPKSILARYTEYLSQCRSNYRGAFTFQSYVDNRVILPVTRAIEILQNSTIEIQKKIETIKPNGILRDSYNHLVAITVENPFSKAGTDILVPVVDDGNSFHQNTALEIHLGVKNIKFASANDTILFYKTVIEKEFVPISPVYRFISIIKGVGILGFRLGNKDTSASILVPCSDDKKQILAGVPIETVDPKNFEFEYDINRKIIFTKQEEDKLNIEKYVLARDQTEDLYQHIRLSFANWIATSLEGGQLRNHIEYLLQNDKLPNYEKLRRLQLEYGPMLKTWIFPDPSYKAPEMSLLRKDCNSISDAKQCSGNCILKDGRCKLHTPEVVQLGSHHKVNIVEYFSTRLFDEILRIPARRYELFNKSVKRFQVPRTNIHIGKEWIIPENVPAWYDLMRETTSERGREMPQFYEEFSRSADTGNREKKIEEESGLVDIPDSLKAELPTESVDSLRFKLVGNPQEDGVRAILRYFGMEQSYKPGKGLDAELLGAMSRKHKNIPIVVLNFKSDPIGITGRSSANLSPKLSVYVVAPEFEKGAAILVTADGEEQPVPARFVQGRIMTSIQPAPLVLKKGRKVDVPDTMPKLERIPSSNSNSSVVYESGNEGVN